MWCNNSETAQCMLFHIHENPLFGVTFHKDFSEDCNRLSWFFVTDVLLTSKSAADFLCLWFIEEFYGLKYCWFISTEVSEICEQSHSGRPCRNGTLSSGLQWICIVYMKNTSFCFTYLHTVGTNWWHWI